MGPVFNMKALNQFIQYKHFKMENLAMLKTVLQKQDYMIKVDLKDAYFCIPVCRKDQQFLRFQWRNKLYQFSCLPFGLTSAPRQFTKLKPIVSLLRRIGMRLLIYLDDLLILNQNKVQLAKDAHSLIFLLQNLGLVINWGKSVLEPTQELEYLGMLINSNTMELKSSPDKVARHTIQVQTNAGSGHYNSAQISSTNRNTDSNNASDTPRSPVLPGNANAQNKTITSLSNILCENHTNPQMQGRTQMVAPPHGDVEWQSNNEPRPGHDHPNGCQLKGLGSLSRGQTGIIRDKWPLVGDRDQTANKLPRTEGSGAGGAIICEEQGVHPCSPEDGQHYSPNAYQQDGGHQITITNTNDKIPLGILLDEEDTPHSRISPRKQEQDSRCPVTTIRRLEQLETRSTTVHCTQQSMGTTGNRFVCRQTECPDHKILQLETRPAGSRYRRFPLAVKQEVLCISSVLPDRQMPYESQEGTDRSGLDRSSMAGPTLVSNTPEHVDRRTDPHTSAQEHLIPNGGGTPNDPEQQPPLSGMASVREANKNAGLSEKASQLLIKGWRKGTRTAYDAA